VSIPGGDVERRDGNAAPAPAIPVVEYSSPPPHNRAASRALLFGLLGFLPFVPAILAIRFGRRGAREAEANPVIGGRSAARAAVVLGVVSLVVWTLVSIAAVPAAIRARRASMRVACAANLRQLGVATMLYAVSNRGFLPPTLDELATSGILGPAAFTCPACAGDPTKPVASSGAYGNYNYVYLGAGRLAQTLRPPQSTPLVYELPTNHLDPGINVLFADGHVELVRGPAAQALLAQANAATQPASAPAVER
jgi:prepilin-type processing-associated H-X9-DG protein